MNKYAVYYFPIETDPEGIESPAENHKYALSGTQEECTAWTEEYIRGIHPDYDFGEFTIFNPSGKTVNLWDEEAAPEVFRDWVIMAPERLELTLWRCDENNILVSPQTITSHYASDEGIDYLTTMALNQCRNTRLTSDCQWDEETDERGSIIATMEAFKDDHQFLWMICTPYHVAALIKKIPVDAEAEEHRALMNELEAAEYLDL